MNRVSAAPGMVLLIVCTALRTPGIGGFELLDLHDFPGQGTALV